MTDESYRIFRKNQLIRRIKFCGCDYKKNAGIYQFIDNELGARSKSSTYSYSDLFRSYLSIILCGGDCAEDISEHLKKELSSLKDFEVCSADTLLRLQKELATKKENHISKNNIEHQFNDNRKLNRLMLKLLIETQQIRPGLLPFSRKNNTYNNG